MEEKWYVKVSNIPKSQNKNKDNNKKTDERTRGKGIFGNVIEE